MKLNLGIVYKDNMIVNHRSLIKVLINPILRYYGFCIATNCENNKLKGIKIIKQQKSIKIKWDFNNFNEHDFIIKKRIFI